MEIKFQCENPECQQRISLDSGMAGPALLCPKCGCSTVGAQIAKASTTPPRTGTCIPLARWLKCLLTTLALSAPAVSWATDIPKISGTVSTYFTSALGMDQQLLHSRKFTVVGAHPKWMIQQQLGITTDVRYSALHGDGKSLYLISRFNDDIVGSRSLNKGSAKVWHGEIPSGNLDSPFRALWLTFASYPLKNSESELRKQIQRLWPDKLNVGIEEMEYSDAPPYILSSLKRVSKLDPEGKKWPEPFSRGFVDLQLKSEEVFDVVKNKYPRITLEEFALVYRNPKREKDVIRLKYFVTEITVESLEWLDRAMLKFPPPIDFTLSVTDERPAAEEEGVGKITYMVQDGKWPDDKEIKARVRGVQQNIALNEPEPERVILIRIIFVILVALPGFVILWRLWSKIRNKQSINRNQS